MKSLSPWSDTLIFYHSKDSVDDLATFCGNIKAQLGCFVDATNKSKNRTLSSRKNNLPAQVISNVFDKAIVTTTVVDKKEVLILYKDDCAYYTYLNVTARANILSTNNIENGVINSKVKLGSKLDNIYLIGASEEYTLETKTTNNFVVGTLYVDKNGKKGSLYLGEKDGKHQFIKYSNTLMAKYMLYPATAMLIVGNVHSARRSKTVEILEKNNIKVVEVRDTPKRSGTRTIMCCSNFYIGSWTTNPATICYKKTVKYSYTIPEFISLDGVDSLRYNIKYPPIRYSNIDYLVDVKHYPELKPLVDSGLYREL